MVTCFSFTSLIQREGWDSAIRLCPLRHPLRHPLHRPLHRPRVRLPLRTSSTSNGQVLFMRWPVSITHLGGSSGSSILPLQSRFILIITVICTSPTARSRPSSECLSTIARRPTLPSDSSSAPFPLHHSAWPSTAPMPTQCCISVAQMDSFVVSLVSIRHSRSSSLNRISSLPCSCINPTVSRSIQRSS